MPETTGQRLALLAKQIDPREHQQEQLRSSLEAKTNTFQLVAERWWNVKKASVTEDYAEDIWRSLERDIFPAIGDVSVTDIKAHTLVQAVQPVQARGALETVRRLCQRINEVMIYAQNTGLIDAVPSVNIGKAFEKPQKKTCQVSAQTSYRNSCRQCVPPILSYQHGACLCGSFLLLHALLKQLKPAGTR